MKEKKNFNRPTFARLSSPLAINVIFACGFVSDYVFRKQILRCKLQKRVIHSSPMGSVQHGSDIILVH